MDVGERLGLKGRRVLLLHHDDLGLTHVQNAAFFALGLPTGSVMVPGAWASQVRGVDLGKVEPAGGRFLLREWMA
ncbi:hypothetical protein TJA_12040 [Thermus sp. LT1-2-5]|uniref:hypothetical protein n=1 Tax=Thermus sp. LT1-2-5 TaxID=3026935 RepID=UPI0030E8A867